MDETRWDTYYGSFDSFRDCNMSERYQRVIDDLNNIDIGGTNYGQAVSV
jgi:hypothetical protein